MLKTLSLPLAAALLVTSAAPAFADAPASKAMADVQQNTATGGYGSAGCGLGSIVMGTKGGWTQVTAATTNATGIQTFAITSGTSNCTDGGGRATARAYIEANREALAREIARGKGESITNLATLAGCSDGKAVGTQLRRNFKKIFPSQTASTESVSDGILTTLQNDKLSCSKLST